MQGCPKCFLIMHFISLSIYIYMLFNYKKINIQYVICMLLNNKFQATISQTCAVKL